MRDIDLHVVWLAGMWLPFVALSPWPGVLTACFLVVVQGLIFSRHLFTGTPNHRSALATELFALLAGASTLSEADGRAARHAPLFFRENSRATSQARRSSSRT